MITKLSAHDFELAVAPLAGGGIAALNWRGLPLLRPALGGAVVARDPLGLSSFPMTPYISRITGGVFTWGDVTTAIAPNMAGGAHPLHGIGWRRPWDVVSQDESQIVLALKHCGDADWPWAFETHQTFTLHQDYFEHHLSVRSNDARAFPASLGPHPYFNATDARITFDAQCLWETSGEALPTHKATPPVIDQLAQGMPASGLHLDHCFEGWDGRACIEWPTHGLDLEAVCALDDQAYPCTRLQLYTPKGEDFFCLEPVSARSVAFGEAQPLAHGVVEMVDQTLSITTRMTPFLA